MPTARARTSPVVLREGGGPNSRERINQVGDFSIYWMPACAGMTAKAPGSGRVAPILQEKPNLE
jgi:hypothetical protein